MTFILRNPNERHTDEELLSDLKRVADELGDGFVTMRDYEANGKYKASTLTSRFGNWAETLRAAGIPQTHCTRPDPDAYIEDLRRVAAELDTDAMNFGIYRDNGGRYSDMPFRDHFGSWANAVREAGLRLQPPRQRMVSDEDLFANIERLWIKHGRQPSTAMLHKPFSHYSIGPYQRRFGSWMKALEAFVAHVSEEETQSDPEGASGPDTHVPTIDVDPASTAGPTSPSEPVQPRAATNTLSNIWRKRNQRRRRSPRHPSLKLTFLVMRRDGFRCKHCGRSPATEPGVTLHIDHIVPWSEGGETWLENLQTLCEQCNLGKGSLSEDIG